MGSCHSLTMSSRGGWWKDLFETFIESLVNVFGCDIGAEVLATCHTVVFDAAWDNTGEMFELWINIDGDSVEGHPMSDSNSDGRNFIFPHPFAFDPYANAVGSTLAVNAEVLERVDNPLFEIMNEESDVTLSLVEIEDGVCNSLSGPMVRVLTAPAGFIDRKARGCKQVAFDSGCSRSVERRVLKKPDELRGASMDDVVDALLHRCHGFQILNRLRGYFPFELVHNPDYIILGGESENV